MKGVSSCTPSSSNFLSMNHLIDFAQAYGVETGSLEVECSLIKLLLSQNTTRILSLADFGRYLLSLRPAYSSVWKLVRVALTIAVTTTESERFFSTMKRIKTRLRSTMTEDRLSDLSILSIENELAKRLQDNDIIDEFASSDKNRRIILFWSTQTTP